MAHSDQSMDSEQLDQFKITIRDVSPMIWRRVLIPENQTLAELHRAIQICFDWMDDHLHHFLIHARQYGLPKPGVGVCGELANHVLLSSIGLRAREKFIYVYDYYDNWIHDIRLEKIIPNDKHLIRAHCIGGKRRSPLEECGGSGRYQDMARLARRGPIRDYLILCLRLGEQFDPDKFSRREVNKKLKEGCWPELIIRFATADDPFDRLLKQMIYFIDHGTLAVTSSFSGAKR